jgi:hypothetical protein
VQDFCEILGCNDTVAVFSALAILESEGKVELRELQKSYREDGGAVFQGVHGISSEYLCDELFSKIERMDKKYAEKCGLDLGKMSEVNRCLRQEIISKWRS